MLAFDALLCSQRAWSRGGKRVWVNGGPGLYGQWTGEEWTGEVDWSHNFQVNSGLLDELTLQMHRV